MAELQTRCFDARRPLFPEILALHEKWKGERAAIICDGEILSWRAFGEASNRVANALIASGLKPGDTVVVAMENGIETVETLFGVMKAGCVSAPLNLTVSDDALTMMIGDSQAKAVIVSENQRARFAGLIKEHGCLQLVALGETDGLWTSYDEWKSAQPVSPPAVDIAPDGLLNIIYSSGTTGRPKGIAHTHLSRLDWAYDLSVALRYHGGARTLCTLALYSNISWVMMLCTFLAGGTLIVTRKFDAGEFVAEAARHRATHTALVPVQLRRIVDHPDFSADKVKSMSAMMSCGSPLHADLKQRIFDTFPAGVIELYGLTEGVATTLDPEEVEGRMASVGKPLLGTDIKIIGDDDRPVPAGEAGEIVGTGRIVMPFYFNRPDETESAIWRDEEGRPWLRTGDVGRLDEDGFLYIVDRKKDLILSGGQNIYPSDIEAVLLKHPSIAAAAVVAAPHDEWGETPFAVVEALEGASEEELAAWSNEKLGRRQRLTGLKIVEALPRNPNGKILKRELRASLFPEHS